MRMTENSKLVFQRVENLIGKGENAVYQHLFRVIQRWDCVVNCELTLSQTMNFRLCQTERVCRREFQI